MCFLWMEATHMPPVENHLCDGAAHKKAPSSGAFFVIRLMSADLRYIGGLRAFLSLYDLELDLIPLGERFES